MDSRIRAGNDVSDILDIFRTKLNATDHQDLQRFSRSPVRACLYDIAYYTTRECRGLYPDSDKYRSLVYGRVREMFRDIITPYASGWLIRPEDRYADCNRTYGCRTGYLDWDR